MDKTTLANEARTKRSKHFNYTDTGGDGPPIVLLHGVIIGADVWDDVVAGLEAEYRCIVPELPFGAHSEPFPDDAKLTLPDIATMLAEFLDELGLEDVVLVSNDWGGAQLVVAPGGSTRVGKIVLASCEAFDNYPPGIPGRLLCLLARVPGGTLLSAQLLRPRFLRHLPITFGDMSKKRVPEAQMQGWLKPLLANAGNRRDLNKYLTDAPTKKQLLDWADEQKEFEGEVLIVWARDDKLMPPKHAERLAEHFEKTTLVWVDDSRTLIPIDQPDRLVEAIRSFLETDSA